MSLDSDLSLESSVSHSLGGVTRRWNVTSGISLPPPIVDSERQGEAHSWKHPAVASGCLEEALCHSLASKLHGLLDTFSTSI